mmetsp:Transcript_28513/g.94609  ORF Transcript_28513/g.94609 Transcript_28513/m.94609 type:complete len:815 (-) Transcript_28513:35-2479(-)|eukprot:CAMPEP_0203859252 /NCGR_PEP_ID=MMETSP0359-20131031/11732_1 /ASSEMBLY_ACC=CAM_ASM_000338 /TAXON_ID=268821 /ORGANISM="Scrippsiella Hangoei, Strain SHTV-5" /LENGTH=814 /DNA_ID=CAMNT_0050776125 /DNA_START=47 /DNA_END=2491 /DNA_ORIENTATION=-
MGADVSGGTATADADLRRLQAEVASLRDATTRLRSDLLLETDLRGGSIAVVERRVYSELAFEVAKLRQEAAERLSSPTARNAAAEQAALREATERRLAGLEEQRPLLASTRELVAGVLVDTREPASGLSQLRKEAEDRTTKFEAELRAELRSSREESCRRLAALETERSAFVASADLASELSNLRQETGDRFAGLGTHTSAQELASELGKLRGESESRFAKLEDELRAELGRLKQESGQRAHALEALEIEQRSRAASGALASELARLRGEAEGRLAALELQKPTHELASELAMLRAEAESRFTEIDGELRVELCRLRDESGQRLYTLEIGMKSQAASEDVAPQLAKLQRETEDRFAVLNAKMPGQALAAELAALRTESETRLTGLEGEMASEVSKLRHESEVRFAHLAAQKIAPAFSGELASELAKLHEGSERRCSELEAQHKSWAGSLSLEMMSLKSIVGNGDADVSSRMKSVSERVTELALSATASEAKAKAGDDALSAKIVALEQSLNGKVEAADAALGRKIEALEQGAAKAGRQLDAERERANECWVSLEKECATKVARSDVDAALEAFARERLGQTALAADLKSVSERLSTLSLDVNANDTKAKSESEALAKQVLVLQQSFNASARNLLEATRRLDAKAAKEDLDAAIERLGAVESAVEPLGKADASELPKLQAMVADCVSKNVGLIERAEEHLQRVEAIDGTVRVQQTLIDGLDRTLQDHKAIDGAVWMQQTRLDRLNQMLQDQQAHIDDLVGKTQMLVNKAKANEGTLTVYSRRTDLSASPSPRACWGATCDSCQECCPPTGRSADF